MPSNARAVRFDKLGQTGLTGEKVSILSALLLLAIKVLREERRVRQACQPQVDASKHEANTFNIHVDTPWEPVNTSRLGTLMPGRRCPLHRACHDRAAFDW